MSLSKPVKYPWAGNTASLTICFSSHGATKVSTFAVQVRLDNSYGDFLNHLKTSNGVKGTLKLVGEKEPSKGITLVEAGILPGTVVKIKGYNPAKTYSQKISVKIPNGPVIHLRAVCSTIGELKHKIQDEIGMLVDEQLLKYNEVNLKNEDLLPRGHNEHQPLILMWQPKKDRKVTGTESKLQTDPKYHDIAKPTEQQLMKELYTTVASEWRPIGTLLEITSEQLNIIDDRHRGDPQKCLLAMLSVWLHRTDPAPSWPEIVAAVDFIKRPDVAQMIREKYYRSGGDPSGISKLPSKSTPEQVEIKRADEVKGTEPRQNSEASKPQTKHHDDSGNSAKLSFPLLPGTSTPHNDGISTGEDTTDSPCVNRKHIIHTDEGHHHQARTQNPDSACSLVKSVPATQPSEPQLEQIADKIVTWEGLATHLGINEQKQEAIKHDHQNEYERQKVKMLYKWRRQNGSKATWKVLVKTSLKVEDRQLAEDIITIYWESSQVKQSTVNPPQAVHPETATESPSPERCRAESGSLHLIARRGSYQDNEEYNVALKSPSVQHRKPRQHEGNFPRIN